MLKKIIALFLICGTFVFCGADEYVEIYNKTVSKLDKGGLYLYYQNTENMHSQISLIIDQFEKETAVTAVPDMALQNIIAFMRGIDFTELQAVGLSGKKINEELYATKAVLSVDKSVGGLLFSAFGKENIGHFNIGAVLPDSTIFAMSGTVDSADFYKKLSQKLAGNSEFQAIQAMFMQMSGMEPQMFAENCKGEYFFGIFKSQEDRKADFYIVLPDKKGSLKMFFSLYAGQNMRTNGGVSFVELPLNNSPFGESMKVIFANNTVAICSNDKIFSSAGRKLADANPQVFGKLKTVRGIGFSVLNFDIADFISSIDSHKYQMFSMIEVDRNGYFINALSNYDLCNWAEYEPLKKILSGIKPINGVGNDDIDDFSE